MNSLVGGPSGPLGPPLNPALQLCLVLFCTVNGSDSQARSTILAVNCTCDVYDNTYSQLR